ncbi:amidohydrolase [Salisediminibacterium halotolerans]|uniref:amidohydrolase n=1 Tax=Salisediminibacterium halotolerans TaxID=517425 RepID=UPI000EB4D3EA|nr:amidohydrolase [Salisediminibacterium halotolerans]RLJ77910.1 5-methylthioadenosine/S-adenosylhomocysteine deaminase [Actinophytocola xinjiangensis]RPE88752.1 5-methylthioadenosine/S-adenosylhomocysteine deaminase [Salisediminibacterium halotolerans]TWG36887.1 5-methylthioadenosine/S-adenosylhomocysteine deaminase [Salisediminibacterium halotolerans]GEL07427.1 5-methylthioadenosine/S-adenosylhomocysteine deaminase [Salisediminibacterium halotolerans]
MSLTLIYNARVITMAEDQAVFTGGVLFDNERIHSVFSGKGDQSIAVKAAVKVDAKGKWLMPGLVNTHAHLGATLLRGLGEDLPLDQWLKTVMWPNEAKLNRELAHVSADLALTEMIRSGTTAYLDMYHLFMDEMAEKAAESGMRAVIARGMIGIGASETEQKAKLDESVQLFKTYHNAAEGRVRVMLAPHAPYTCPPDFLRRTADIAKRNNISVHTHLAETRTEIDEYKAKYQKHPASHLAELGLFDVPALVAHGVHLSDREINLLKEKDVAVSHNPISNLKLGSGVAPLRKLTEAGVKTALGTDSAASNNTLDMFEELRSAALIHKGMHENPQETKAYDLLKMAGQTGAEVLGFNNTGRIESGCEADLILIDPDAPHLTPSSVERTISHLVYAVKGSDVTDVWVKGRQLMNNRELTSLDEEKIRYEANQSVKKFD